MIRSTRVQEAGAELFETTIEELGSVNVTSRARRGEPYRAQRLLQACLDHVRCPPRG